MELLRKDPWDGDSNQKTTYYGYGRPGLRDEDAGWSVVRKTYFNGVEATEYPNNGTGTTQSGLVWNDRATYTYNISFDILSISVDEVGTEIIISFNDNIAYLEPGMISVGADDSDGNYFSVNFATTVDKNRIILNAFEPIDILPKFRNAIVLIPPLTVRRVGSFFNGGEYHLYVIGPMLKTAQMNKINELLLTFNADMQEVDDRFDMMFKSDYVELMDSYLSIGLNGVNIDIKNITTSFESNEKIEWGYKWGDDVLLKFSDNVFQTKLYGTIRETVDFPVSMPPLTKLLNVGFTGGTSIISLTFDSMISNKYDITEFSLQTLSLPQTTYYPTDSKQEENVIDLEFELLPSERFLLVWAYKIETNWVSKDTLRALEPFDPIEINNT